MDTTFDAGLATFLKTLETQVKTLVDLGVQERVTHALQSLQTGSVATGTKPVAKAKAASKAKAEADASGKPPCSVPDCGRSQIAKKLCPTHYRKANRLSFDGPEYTAIQLATLGEDGRSTRYANAAAATTVPASAPAAAAS